MSNFVFDNIPSHVFGLAIGHIGSSGVSDINTYSNVEIIKDMSAKRIEPYYYGVKLPSHIEFPMEIYNKHGLHYEMFDVLAIQEWLFGKKEAKYLSILEPDKGAESYLCWLTDPKIVKVGNKVIGWKFLVVCTTCYSVTNIVEEKYECLNDTSQIIYYNLSNVEDYIYPELSVQLLGNSTYFRLENLSDNNRVFQIINMKLNTSFYVNNDHQYMSAENGEDIFQNFNLNWFRFAFGHNKINVNGRCIITFRNRFMKSVGGY